MDDLIGNATLQKEILSDAARMQADGHISRATHLVSQVRLAQLGELALRRERIARLNRAFQRGSW
jgi:hypothetical protein